MKVKLNEQGLVPAIAQDINTNQVLMLGYMNPGSIKRTVEGVQVWFYSRSREDLWHKGEVSGNYLNLKEAWLDCDGDTLLLKVDPDGPACHTGETSCFFNPLEASPKVTKTPIPVPAYWPNYSPWSKTASGRCRRAATRSSCWKMACRVLPRR